MMKRAEVEEVIECLPDKYKFPYFKDRYALMLLADFVEDECTVAEVRRSPFAKLLARPGVAPVLAAAGGGKLTRKMLDWHWPDNHLDTEDFSLTLDQWGDDYHWERGDDQMARAGVNLVLQLNFSGKHDAPYRRLIRKHHQYDPFKCVDHPINGNGLQTLAWARLDLDFSTGEVLIEEIQSDWLRWARRAHREAQKWLSEGRSPVLPNSGVRVTRCYADAVGEYVNSVLAPYYAMWSEAMLMATIWFVKSELGLKDIYMYDYPTGNLLKGLPDFDCPPRSLYTDLPKRFCMERREDLPAFLANEPDPELQHMAKVEELTFWRMTA